MGCKSDVVKDVLFQKLGNTWYVFCEVDQELVFSALPAGVNPQQSKLELYSAIENHMKKFSERNKKLKKSNLEQAA